MVFQCSEVSFDHGRPINLKGEEHKNSGRGQAASSGSIASTRVEYGLAQQDVWDVGYEV